MPPKEALLLNVLHHQRVVENSQLKTQLIDMRRARQHCIVCDVFLGDRLDEAVQVASQDAGPNFLICSKDIYWNKTVRRDPPEDGGWGTKRGREWDGEDVS